MSRILPVGIAQSSRQRPTGTPCGPVDAERARSSRKLNRLPRWFRHLPRVVLVFDFLLLLYFLSVVTDVNWASAVTAAGVCGSPGRDDHARLLRMLRLHRRPPAAHKEHSGRIPPGSLDWLTTMLVIACAVGIAVLGFLMFSRMWSEVLIALGNGATTTAISVAAAVTAVSVLANVMVISVHALDGSEETDQLDAFGAAVRRSDLRADRMRRRAARLDHRIAVRVRKAQRVMAGGESRAGRPSMIADEIVGNARAIHQRTGSLSEATVAALSRVPSDHSPLEQPGTGRTGLAPRPQPDRDGPFRKP